MTACERFVGGRAQSRSQLRHPPVRGGDQQQDMVLPGIAQVRVLARSIPLSGVAVVGGARETGVGPPRVPTMVEQRVERAATMHLMWMQAVDESCKWRASPTEMPEGGCVLAPPGAPCPSSGSAFVPVRGNAQHP